MKIELTEKQFRRLLDLVYIGNWVLNSTRGDDRIREYDEVESTVFSNCINHGMVPLVESYQGADRAPSPRAASMRLFSLTRTRCSSRFSPRSSLCATWTPTRPRRKITTSCASAWMCTFLGEFEQHGTDNITVEM